nr:hypothetical protein [Tanacetum cinerariifolium]
VSHIITLQRLLSVLIILKDPDLRIFNKCYQSPSSVVFPLPVMCSHNQKKFPLLEESSHCQKKLPLLARLRKSSKDLEDIIESQRSDQVKEGVGYNVVPPPAADLYHSSNKDLSWTGLPEFADDTVTDYSRPSPT